MPATDAEIFAAQTAADNARRDFDNASLRLDQVEAKFREIQDERLAAIQVRNQARAALETAWADLRGKL